MLAGDSDIVGEVAPLLAAMCRRLVPCGPVPQALRMKLAVNLYLLTTVAGLVEAYHLAERQGLDIDVFRQILDEGQMASDVSRVKGEKLQRQDYSAQAALRDVVKNALLVTQAAREAGAGSPMLDAQQRSMQRRRTWQRISRYDCP